MGVSKVMRKFDAVIFDMDGLMVDTERMMQKEVKEIIKEMGFSVTEEITLKLIGLTDSRTKNILEQEYGKEFRHDIFLKKLLDRKEMVYHNDEIPVKKGLWELLEFLKKENIKSIVATGSVRESMNLILQRTGILEHFTLSVCGDEIERGKPYPDIFKSCRKIKCISKKMFDIRRFSKWYYCSKKCRNRSDIYKRFGNTRKTVYRANLCRM